MISVGKLTADLIAINKCGSDIGSRTSTQYKARAKRSHAQNKQCHNHPCRSLCSASLRTLYPTSFGEPGLTLNIAIKVILIFFICLNMWVNIMVLAPKSGPRISAKTGNPAGLPFRRKLVFRRKIWGTRDNGIPPRSTRAEPFKMIYTSLPPPPHSLLHMCSFQQQLIGSIQPSGNFYENTIHSHSMLSIACMG